MSFQRQGEYEELYNAYKKERQTKNLQALPLNFFHKFEDLLYTSNTVSDDFKVLIRNRMKEMLCELYQIRKDKILDQVMINSNFIETELLSKAEKRFYLTLTLANSLLTQPGTSSQILPISIKEELQRSVTSFKNLTQEKMEINNDHQKESGESSRIEKMQKKLVQIKILKDLPEFMGSGPDNSIYGPYKTNQIVKLPSIIVNQVLIPRKLAKLIDDNKK